MLSFTYLIKEVSGMNARTEWLDVKQVAVRLGFKNYMSVWKEARTRPGFPKSVKLGARRTRWIAEEIDEWISARIAESIKKSASRVASETRES